MSGRGGFGRGFGRGFGGRGMGRGFGWNGSASYVSGRYSSKSEAELLKEQAQFMQEEILAMNQRIKELESTPGIEGNK